METQNEAKNEESFEPEKIIGRLRVLMEVHEEPVGAIAQLFREMTPTRRPGRRPGPLHDYTPHLEHMAHLIRTEGNLSIRKAAEKACSWATGEGLASVSPQTLRKHFSRNRAQLLPEASHDGSTETNVVFRMTSFFESMESSEYQKLLAESELARIPGLTADGMINPAFHPVEARIQRNRRLQEILAPFQIEAAPPKERLALRIKHFRRQGFEPGAAERLAKTLTMLSSDPEERRSVKSKVIGKHSKLAMFLEALSEDRR